MKGLILNIERFSIHDGPGIRTVVFLKGCPLRCIWCSTPDGQNMFPELEYFSHKCIKCGRCIDACPKKAIVKLNDEIVTLRYECTLCGKCVEKCLSGARKIVGKEMTVEDVLKEVEKDMVFYSSSGGGVTLSGGDPISQPEFSAAILKMCRERGINTCIETSAYGDWGSLAKMLAYTDFLYVDIKHIDPLKHKKFTGKSNRKILKNIENISKSYPDMPVVVRVPVVPGYTDDMENIRAIALFVSGLGKNFKIELLPYHRLGIHRYEALSRPYLLRDLMPPPHEHIKTLKRFIESYGVKVIMS
ncbi:MAG: glycyl-radical enzyme activating protein [Candidatus Bathyarchaeia archaeon]|nr:glycyl-radical enzyme activating protein [Candidatus Bathyarchaeota archaeon]